MLHTQLHLQNEGNYLQEAEAQIISTALKQYQHNKSDTAKALGISRTSLQMKLKQYFGDQYIKPRKYVNHKEMQNFLSNFTVE